MLGAILPLVHKFSSHKIEYVLPPTGKNCKTKLKQMVLLSSQICNSPNNNYLCSMYIIY